MPDSGEYLSSLAKRAVSKKLNKTKRRRRSATSSTNTVHVITIQPWSCPAQCQECREWEAAHPYDPTKGYGA